MEYDSISNHINIYNTLITHLISYYYISLAGVQKYIDYLCCRYQIIQLSYSKIYARKLYC